MRERRLIAETITDNIGLELESHMREFICDAVFNSLRLTEERCKMFFQEQLEKKRNLNEIKRHHAHMEDYLHQSFRQRNIQLCSELSEFDAITMTEPHVIAIRRNATLLKENLDLEGTLLLDRLMGNDVLSEAGRKSILSRKTRVGQNCAFLDHVTKTFNANSFKTVFLPALQKEHESLSNELEKDLDLPNASFPAVRRCQSCEVKSKISIRKFANHLHQSGIIDEALCSELVLSERPHDERWKLIVKKLKKNKRDVMSALRTFHEQCYQMLKTTKSSLFHCFCDELDTQKSDVTRTVDTGSGEPDVARMSDFSSEVDSIASPTLYFDRRHQNVSDITNAPYPFTCWDRDIFSPSLSSALNDKGKDENTPYSPVGMPTRDYLRAREFRFNKNRKRYSPLSSSTVTPFSKYENSGRDENLPIAHGEMKTRGYLHERTFGFANDSTEAWHRRRSLRRFFLRTRSLRIKGNQLQHEGDTTKAPSSISSFSPLSSPPQSPLSVPEFKGRDENLPNVHGEMKTRGYLHERSFGFANDSTDAWHRRRVLRRFFLPTRSFRRNQLQHEGDTTKAPSSISSFSPLSSPPQSPLSVPEFKGRDENLPYVHGEMKTRGYLHERTFGFANDSTDAWHRRQSLRGFVLPTRSFRIKGNQLQHEGDTTKAPSSISSFSPLSSPPQSPLSVPEFKGRDENLPYVHGEMKTRGYLHERTFGFANDSTDACHRRQSLRGFVLPTRSFRSNQLQHEGDTTKAPSSISSFSPLSSPPQSPLSVPEFEVKGHQPQADPETMKVSFTPTSSFSPSSSPPQSPLSVPEFEVKGHQPQADPETMKISFTPTSSFSPSSSPPQSPLSVPEFED